MKKGAFGDMASPCCKQMGREREDEGRQSPIGYGTPGNIIVVTVQQGDLMLERRTLAIGGLPDSRYLAS
jgi:hypothetical protein